MTASIAAASGLRGLPDPTGRYIHRQASLTSEQQPSSSGWHPVQLPSCFSPSEGLSLEPGETGLSWQDAPCPLEHSCSAVGNRKRPDPGLQARGLWASILSGT